MKSLIMNNPGQSSYFNNQYKGYGRYQWNIKYYNWQDEDEIELAINWAFGSYVYHTGEFDYLNDVVGRPVKAHIAGQSGGWLVVDTELTKEELDKVSAHVASCMAGLDKFLAEERENYNNYMSETAIEND